MYINATALKALSVAVASTCLLACSNGTSKSSSDQNYNNSLSNNQTDEKTPIQLDLLNDDPVEINQNNYYTIASSTLKSLLLTDTTTGALGQSASMGLNGAKSNSLATGVDIDVAELHCGNGGYLKITGQVLSSENTQSENFDLNDALSWTFNAAFDACEQGGNRLTGQVKTQFDLNLAQLINAEQTALQATMSITDLLVEDVEVPTVLINGTYGFVSQTLENGDVSTKISTTDTIFSNDTDYQQLDYELEKIEDPETGEYSYSIHSVFSASFLEDGKVEYLTEEPLRGVGHAYPSSGRLIVYGVDSTMYINPIENEVVFIELDIGSDGSIDREDYASWSDLVLDPTVDPGS